MRKVLVYITLIILLNIFTLPAEALSPGGRTRDCLQNKNAHFDCELVLCKWDNVAKNWPVNTGYYKDCDTEKEAVNKKVQIYIGLGIAFIVLVVACIVYLKRRARRMKKV